MLTSAAIFAIAASFAPACAQSAASETADAGAPTSDIIVTARRTDERLQDVPVAVTAFGADALEERKISSEIDLQVATPGLTVRQTGSSDQLNYAIRGQSIDAFSFSSPAVVTYFNDVQAGGGAATSFFDLASIQVLKGPQGTLFGRNATGGAVLYSSAKPSLDTGGYVKLGYGNYENKELEAALNLGVAQGFAIRLSGKIRKRDGFQTNLLDGTHPNSIDSKVGRLSVLIAPEGSNFENSAMVQIGRFGGLTGGTKLANANGVNGTPATYNDPITNNPVAQLVTNLRDVYGPGGPGAAIVPGFTDIGDFLTKQRNIGFYDFYGNSNSMRRGRSTLVSNTTKFELSDNMTLKNIFGYNKVFNRENSDIDGSPYEFLLVGGGVADRDQGYSFGTKQISDELQLSGDTGALTYIFGAFISKEETYNRIPLRVTRDLGGLPLGAYDFTVTNKSKALYGQLTYALSDRLNLTGGLRYTWENVDLTHGPDSLLNVLNTLGNHSRKDSNPSWLVSLDYKITDDLLVYLSHRGSWRTGGFNGTSNNIPTSFDVPTFKPETTYDFEAGLKFAGDLGTMPARLNIAVYDQTIKDVQRAPYLNISALAGNVNKARVSGVEVDGKVVLSSWFEVGGAFAYTNARFTDARALVASTNFIFGPYADSPKTTGSAYARLSTELADGQEEISLRAEVYGQSHFFYSNLGNTIVPNARIAGYKLVNVRAEWDNMRGSGVKGAIYASNLTNKEYEVGGFPLGAVIGGNSTLPGTPRMYGIELGIQF
jgi:iron complex outermembrane recepter protein